MNINIGSLIAFEVSGRIVSGIVVEIAEEGFYWVQDSDGTEYFVNIFDILQCEVV